MDRRRAFLPSRQIYRITPKYPEARPSAGVVPSRIAQVGPQEPPAPSLRCAQKGAPLRGVSLLWTTWTIRGAEAQHSHLTTLQQMATGLQWHRHPCQRRSTLGCPARLALKGLDRLLQ